MSTSSENGGSRTKSKRDPAWTFLLVNAAVLPGLGSIAAKRKVGFVQAAMALSGVGLTMFFAGWLFLHQFQRDPALPAPESYAEAFEWDEHKAFYFTGLAGMGLVAAAWAWSVLTAFSVIRQTRRAP